MKADTIWCSRSLITNPLFFGICTSEKLFKKELRRLKIKDGPDFLLTDHANATAHFFEKDGKTSALVCINGKCKNSKIEIYALLVHEAVHIWQKIRSHIGEHNPSDEFEAYSIQQISLELMSNFEAQLKEAKK